MGIYFYGCSLLSAFSINCSNLMSVCTTWCVVWAQAVDPAHSEHYARVTVATAALTLMSTILVISQHALSWGATLGSVPEATWEAGQSNLYRTLMNTADTDLECSEVGFSLAVQAVTVKFLSLSLRTVRY